MLNDTGLAVIDEQRNYREKANPYVFAGKLDGQHIHRPKKAFERIKAAAGGLDNLRHSFASMLINSGATLYETQHLLGHHNPQTNTRYAHLSTGRLRALSGQVSEYVSSVIGS